MEENVIGKCAGHTNLQSQETYKPRNTHVDHYCVSPNVMVNLVNIMAANAMLF